MQLQQQFSRGSTPQHPCSSSPTPCTSLRPPVRSRRHGAGPGVRRGGLPREEEEERCAGSRSVQACTQATGPVWEGESVSVAELRAQLDAALAVEDYKTAASLRDSIQLKLVDSKLAVEDVNSRFYTAFRNGDYKGMDSTWGHGEHVQVIHPGGECIAGRDMVMDSWRSVLANIRPRAFQIDLEDVRIFAADNHAFVTCVEIINADENKGRICATNIFEKQNGEWLIVLHHGSIAPLLRRKLRSTIV